MAKPILIVDDDVDMRQLLQDVCESGGYASVSAWNGREALKVLETLKKSKNLPGLILLDLKMPVMDGQTFISVLQSESHQKSGLENIPIVVMSAHSVELKGQVIEYIMKPPKIDMILDIAGRYCENSVNL
ncbi:MAG: response regulator [Bdellovibrionota bacterium]